MSTLKTTNLQHPSAGVPAIVLDADGDATYAGVHDFSAATVTGAPQGLVHINTTTFSAVSSVSINDVFTSDYQNYKVLIKGISSNNGVDTFIRYRTSGTDNSSATYQLQYIEYFNSTLGAFRANNQTNALIGLFDDDNDANFISTEISSPNLAARTTALSTAISANGGGFVRTPYTYFNNTTIFDGFTFYGSSGTLTGTIRVYGYRNEA